VAAGLLQAASVAILLLSSERKPTTQKALALAGELGMRPLVAQCHFHLGKLFRKTDQLEQAREDLTTATTTYREMDMRSWMD